MSRIQLTMQEIKKGKVMDQLLRKELVPKEAAQILSISQRQVSRLVRRYKEAGIAGLAHKGRGRRSNRRIAEGQRSKIADLIKEHYWDYGPTLASETLQERDNIKLCKETTRQIMLEYNIWKSHTKNRKRKSWRKPRSIFGQMAQLDGSWHNWFEGRAPWAMLIKFVDDATSNILFAMFAPSESYASVAQATIAYFKQHGMPNELYTDKGSVFKVHKADEDDDLITQYEYALSMLQVSLSRADTPQAKGRIERSFKTDQDRMIKAMRLDKINSIEDANIYLKEVYIPRHNSKFGRVPEIEGNSHRPINDINLYDVFCIRETRTVRNDWTIKFKNNLIQICDQRSAVVKPKDVVNVCQRIDGTIYITTAKAQRLDFKILESGLPTDKEPKPLKRQYKPARRISIDTSESTDPEKLGHFYLAEK